MIGGFIVFTFLLFGIPSIAIQWRLYQARIIQDRYRLKFNKVLRGLKDKKYRKKSSSREYKLGVEDLEPEDGASFEEGEEAQDPEADNASQTSAERAEARMARQRAKAEMQELEKEMVQVLEVEGGEKSLS